MSAISGQVAAYASAGETKRLSDWIAMEECPATGRFRKVSASQPRLLVIRRRTIPEPAGNCESSVTRVPDRSAGKQCGGRVPLSGGVLPHRQTDKQRRPDPCRGDRAFTLTSACAPKKTPGISFKLFDNIINVTRINHTTTPPSIKISR